MDDYIEKINTAKPIHRNLAGVIDSIMEMQAKINELVDAVNLYLTPDDDINEDDGILVAPSDLLAQAKHKDKPKKSK